MKLFRIQINAPGMPWEIRNRIVNLRLPLRLGLLVWFMALLTDGLGQATAAFTTERVASGLNRPVFVTAPAGDGERIFILEQRGKILIVKNGNQLTRPFLDIEDLVTSGSFNDERGLLGMAFHPDYGSNGYFFVHYTDTDDSTSIMRYSVSPDPDRADSTSAQRILKVYQPRTNHNGGTIAFGPGEGYLYIGLGDGGGSGDPDNLAQADSTLLGKMLRIDVNSVLPYGIPPDNPHTQPGDPRDEIWAKGLRNPYRWSFDRLTADMYIGDVGQFIWEEIDFQPAGSSGGENYGWRLMEGDNCFNPPSDCDPGGLTYPVHTYQHGPGCSVTGGYVYRGDAIPELQGHYFFADWCSDQIWSFKLVGGVVTEFQERTSQLAPGGGMSIRGVSGFGEDGLGELYIVDRNSENQGEVYKIVPVVTGVNDPHAGPPVLFELAQNYPNPFNPITTISFTLHVAQHTRLAVYTMAGKLVQTLLDSPLEIGHHTVQWDGRGADGRRVASGAYIYRLGAGEAYEARRMVILK